jgi:hypothetical protein
MRQTLLLLYVVATVSVCLGQIPRTLSHQGFFTNAQGVPLDTTLPMKFRLFSDSANGNDLWQQIYTSVVVSRGVFTVTLGPIDLSFGQQYWLQVEPDGQIISPRTKLTSAAYALRADTTDNVNPNSAIQVRHLKVHQEGDNGIWNVDLGYKWIGSYPFVANFQKDDHMAWIRLSGAPYSSVGGYGIWFHHGGALLSGWSAALDNGGKFNIGYGSGSYEGEAITNSKDGQRGIVIDTSGIVTIYKQSLANVAMNEYQYIPSGFGVNHKLKFNIEEIDRHDEFDTTQNRFYPRQAGVYLISYQVCWIDIPSAGVDLRANIFRNTTLMRGHVAYSPGPSYVTNVVSCTIGMSPGDYLEFTVSQNSGSDQRVSKDPRCTYVNIAKIH